MHQKSETTQYIHNITNDAKYLTFFLRIFRFAMQIISTYFSTWFYLSLDHLMPFSRPMQFIEKNCLFCCNIFIYLNELAKQKNYFKRSNCWNIKICNTSVGCLSQKNTSSILFTAILFCTYTDNLTL